MHIRDENTPYIHVEPQDKELNTIFTEFCFTDQVQNITRVRFYYIKVNKRENTNDSYELEENTNSLMELHNVSPYF